MQHQRTEASIRAQRRSEHPRLHRHALAEPALHLRVRVLLGERLLKGEPHLVGREKGLGHVGAAGGRCARDPRRGRALPARHHFERRMAAERPAHDGRLLHAQRFEQRHRGTGKSVDRIGPLEHRRVGTLAMARQVESDEAVALGHRRGELPAEHFLAGGIAMDEEHGRTLAAALHIGERSVCRIDLALLHPLPFHSRGIPPFLSQLAKKNDEGVIIFCIR